MEKFDPKFDRRDLLKVAGGAMAAASFVGAASARTGAAAGPSALGEFNVLDYGAVGDGKQDNTAAFQRALAAAEQIGGIVRVPPGQFRFDGTISIPTSTILEGSWEGPHYPDHHRGSLLLPCAGRDQESADPFVTLASNSTIKGLSFYYPEQKGSDIRPYPWTIAIRGDRASIIDIAMANTYNAVDCGTHDNTAPHMRNLNITALRRGIYLDRCYDIARIENVHIVPSEWSFREKLSREDDEAINRFTIENLEGYIIGKTDWAYMIDCFVIWARMGFHFIPMSVEPGRDIVAPQPNIVITQSGCDLSPVGVVVEATQDHAGIAFENCQFMNSIEINETNTGPVKLTNCGFWGQSRSGSVILNKGQGEVLLNNCHFSAWVDKYRNNHPWDPTRPFIDCQSGYLLMTACVFKDYGNTPNYHVHLGPEVVSAVLNGNLVHGGGKMKVQNQTPADVQIFGNVEVSH